MARGDDRDNACFSKLANLPLSYPAGAAMDTVVPSDRVKGLLNMVGVRGRIWSHAGEFFLGCIGDLYAGCFFIDCAWFGTEKIS